MGRCWAGRKLHASVGEGTRDETRRVFYGHPPRWIGAKTINIARARMFLFATASRGSLRMVSVPFHRDVKALVDAVGGFVSKQLPGQGDVRQ